MARTKIKTGEGVTIIDVAAEAGVSYATVSRVVNGSSLVNEKTRVRVLRAMQKLNYVANRQARSLAGGKTHLIGFLVSELGLDYTAFIARGFEAELNQAGYEVVLYTHHRNADKEQAYVDILTQGAVDGVLVSLPRCPDKISQVLTERHFPYVMVDYEGVNDYSPAVYVTNWQGAYGATQYLIHLGHRRIGFITGTMDLRSSQDRLAGYEAALKAEHLAVDSTLVVEGFYQQIDGYKAAQALLSLDDRPTAIFASNDVMALGVMEAVRECGLHIPEDISLVGFDDISAASLVRPALTTVRQPLEHMGRVAAQMLLDVIRDPEKPTRRIILPTELVIRESCRAISREN